MTTPTDAVIRSAYAAALEYPAQAEACLDGKHDCLPDAHLLCRDTALPGGTILHAAPREDEYGPYIAVKIDHGDEDRNSRLFDLWDMPPLYLLEITGLRLRWHRTTQKGKPYLRLMLTPPGSPASAGIPVARAIANSPPGMETRFARGHHDLRRAALTFASADHRQHPPKFGREDAVRIACEHYEKRGMAVVLGVATEAFKAQLERAFKIADAMHASRYSEEAD